MNNHPYLLNVINEFHIIIETISIPILVVGRPKKLQHFLLHKVSTLLQTFKARVNVAQTIH
jgi:hypothetical protein